MLRVWGRLTRPPALTLLALVLLAPAAQARWFSPFQFTAPGSLDLAPPQLALSPGGAAAAAFGVEDVDVPGGSQAYVSLRTAAGALGAPLPISGAGQILALGFHGAALELLTGSSPINLTCCSSVQAVKLTEQGVLEQPRSLVGGLTGTTLGRILTLADGRMLAAVASERGVWVAQSSSGDRFAPARGLSAAGQLPESLAAAWLGAENTIVAWTSGAGLPGAAVPHSIYYATGSGAGAPHRVRTLLTVAAGHRIDELDLARRGSRATVVWVESWSDRLGNFHSEVSAADIASRAGIRRLSTPTQRASGVAIGGNAAGDQAISWKACPATGGCTADAAAHGPKASFGPSVSLGGIDASQTPALAVGPGGQVVVGCVRSGRPVAVVGSARTGGWGGSGGTTVLSSTVFAHDLAVAIGSGGQALAAWAQGTLNPSVVGSVYRPG